MLTAIAQIQIVVGGDFRCVVKNGVIEIAGILPSKIEAKRSLRFSP